MEKKEYTSLKKLVNDEFTITKVWGYKWKKYDPDSKRMLVEEKYTEGYRKLYGIETDKGSMDVSAGQLGNMLEGVMKDGKADLIGRTFHVKSNGKDGMDIRYYINPVYTPNAAQEAREDKIRETANEVRDEVFLDDIPF